MYQELLADVLVIGGGAAGVRAALGVADLGRSVVLLSKGPIARSGATPLAGESFNASLHPEDSPELHYLDTLRGGRGLADGPLVRALAREAPGQVRWLVDIGHGFRRAPDGSVSQVIRPGQSHPRACRAVGGGWGLARTLFRKTADFPNLRLLQNAFALRLLLDDGRVCGALYLDLASGALDVVRAGAVILAAGGYGYLWSATDCPPSATGEVATLALEAGATVVDPEMVQFYPAVGIHPPAVRGLSLGYESCLNPSQLGGRVVNGRGEEFIVGFPMRDELTHAISREVEEGRGSPHGGAYLDLLHSPFDREELARRLRTWLPALSGNLLRLGIDLTEQRVEVAPATHFSCGGVHIDDRCATGVPGLFAAGECAGNVQGANRIAGNALAETQVFGARAADSAVAFIEANGPSRADIESPLRQEGGWMRSLLEPKMGGVRPCHLKQEVRDLVGSACGPRRSRAGLQRGLEALGDLKGRLDDLAVQPVRRGCYEMQEALEVRAMVRLAECVFLGALRREESRGVHFRTDYPNTKDVAEHTVVTAGPGGLAVASIPVLS